MRKVKVIIVGGGLSGIACARKLQERNIDFLLLEASDRLGGRVRTESGDGFLFDCGFQTCCKAFQSVFHYFSIGLAQLPIGGMGQIPLNLAKAIKPERVLLNRKVVSVSKNVVQLEDGDEVSADAVVLALNVDSLREFLPEIPLPRTNSVSNFYFESENLWRCSWRCFN